MEGKELIEKIKLLREIKPRKKWVFLAKREILGQPKLKLSLFSNAFLIPLYSRYQLTLASFLLLGILISGAFVLAQNSLPGDFLYPLKRISDKSQAVFVSEKEKPVFQLKLANEKLENLTKATAKNLAPTINEFQANISQAAKNLTKSASPTLDPGIIKKIVEETKKLEEKKEKAERLGVVVGETEELENALAKVVENLIEDLKNRTLSEEKAEVLRKMESLFEEGKYSEALEFYLISQ